MKESVILYVNQYDAISSLPLEDKGRLLDAIFAHVKGETVSLPTSLQLAFQFFKSQIENDTQKYDARCKKNKENAEKRWQNMQSDANGCNRMQSQRTDANDAMCADRIGYDRIGKDIKKKVSTKVDRKKSVFSKPTITDINNYICENSYNVDGQKFFDFYESNGWRVGKNPMKDWKASIRTWARSDRKTSSSSSASIMTDFSGDYSEKF
jgi:hypothetical protein